ncbi:hypothetical protein BaRGS_00010022, partial [Batillaria attramentaria]
AVKMKVCKSYQSINASLLSAVFCCDDRYIGVVTQNEKRGKRCSGPFVPRVRTTPLHVQHWMQVAEKSFEGRGIVNVTLQTLAYSCGVSGHVINGGISPNFIQLDEHNCLEDQTTLPITAIAYDSTEQWTNASVHNECPAAATGRVLSQGERKGNEDEVVLEVTDGSSRTIPDTRYPSRRNEAPSWHNNGTYGTDGRRMLRERSCPTHKAMVSAVSVHRTPYLCVSDRIPDHSRRLQAEPVVPDTSPSKRDAGSFTAQTRRKMDQELVGSLARKVALASGVAAGQ